MFACVFFFFYFWVIALKVLVTALSERPNVAESCHVVIRHASCFCFFFFFFQAGV